jgi:hypothetical protein
MNKFFELCAEEQERILNSIDTSADAGIGAPDASIEEICEARGFEVVFEYRGFTVAVDAEGDPVALWDNAGPCAAWL